MTDQAKPTALLPCPFCGGAAEQRVTDGPTRGFIGCFSCMIGTPFNVPYGEHERKTWNTRTDSPLCDVHRHLESSNRLEVQIGGNNCVACSLNERAELLNILAPFAAPDGSADSLQVLQSIITRAHSPAQAEWLPIESAPKDGTAILVANPNHVKQVRWMISAAKARPDGGWFVGGYDGWALTWKPTVWQHLPQPPKGEQDV